MDEHDVIAAVYDAARHWIPWEVPLEKLCLLTRCSAARLVYRDSAQPLSSIEIDYGAGTGRYADTLAALDARLSQGAPLRPVVLGDLPDAPMTGDEVADRAPAQGEPDAAPATAGICLIKASGRHAWLALARPAMPLAGAELARLVPVARHLAHTLGQWRAQEHEHQRTGAIAHLFETLRVGAALLDGEARPLLANPAAEALFRGHPALALRAGRLRLRDTTQHRRFAHYLHMALSGQERRTRGVLLRTPERAPLLLTLAPWRHPPQYNGPHHGLLLLSDLAEPPPLHAGLLADLFALTPAEALVAVGIARGYSLERIAAQHAVSIHTVRSQVKAVLAKTATTRQNELARVLWCGALTAAGAAP